MIQFAEVTKSYGNQQVLTIPSLQLNRGIYWLQGINGSGKTTLLRMLAGLIPFSGDILLEGISLRHQPMDYRRHTSLAEAEPAYPVFVTGRELVCFYQHIRKVPSLRIDELIGFFRVQSYLSAPIGTYSSGMIKKLSLLLAFIGTPPLILLDEPLATLDAEALLSLPGLIQAYHQDFGISFIFSSHQPVQSDSFPIDKKLRIEDRVIHLVA
jgi:ABC-2 type transport system ATP-binding protein